MINETDMTQGGGNAKAEAFTFGDPEAVLDRRELLDYVECWRNGDFYEPPLPFDVLSRVFRAAVHHSSPLYLKRNVLVSTYQEHPALSRTDFARFVLDYMVFGNAYLERRKTRGGGLYRLVPVLAKFTRRGVEADRYWFVHDFKAPLAFERGAVFHLLEPDINQEIYGLPEYLSAMNSILLNEAATLFRRRYYKNGSHAGFILYINDAAHQQADVDAMRTALKEAKGPGNFRNLFLYAPNGKKDGIQIIPIAEVMAKDDFLNIKNSTRDDQLAAHRVPPQLLGMMPNSTGGFGDVEKAAKVFARNEVEPLQVRLQEVNTWLGEEVIRFEPYEIPGLEKVEAPPVR